MGSLSSLSFGFDPLWCWSTLAFVMVYIDIAHCGSSKALCTGLAASAAAVLAWKHQGVLDQAACFAAVGIALVGLCQWWIKKHPAMARDQEPLPAED